jgi:hypothetical protein
LVTLAVGHHCPCHPRNLAGKQPLDPLASNPRYDPELCKAGAERVDNRRLLRDE